MFWKRWIRQEFRAGRYKSKTKILINMKQRIEQFLSFLFGVTFFQIVLLWEYLEEKYKK